MRVRLVAVAVLLGLAVVPARGGVDAVGRHELADSLPHPTSGARPGPDVLYSTPPVAPQLENRDPRFRAEPLLVSGTEAYIDGEYLYQDHIYDDYGSDTGASDSASTDSAGDIEYPTNRARYGGNAADLVELRIASGRDSVAYRFTLNTLLAPDSTIATIAFDTDRDASTGKSTLPRDPGASFPGTDEVVTAWGVGAEHSRIPTSGAPTTTALDVRTDLEANQITVTVPRSVSDPHSTWRATVAVGLFDPTSGGWLRAQTSASADRPGGATPKDPSPTGILNVGFRFSEAPSSINGPDSKQAPALADKAPTRFAREIDFGALDRREDRSTVPATGTMVRIFPSRIDLGEGRDHTKRPEYLGRLQPYSLYVPKGYDHGKPAGLTLNLHSLGEYHYQYNGSKGVQQIGEDRGNLVATATGRGEDGWYQAEAEFDVFEMWNDVARHYRLDPDRVAITGYSMGGYATYRLATLYPDLFGRAFSIVGPPGEGIWAPPAPLLGGAPHSNTNLWLENARNVPFLNVVAAADELVPIAGTRAQNLGAPEIGIRGFEQLGYRFRFVVYPTAEHLTLAVLSYDLPYAKEFLGEARVDRDPDHVTFAYLPATDDARYGLVHDHAYWVSDVRLTDAKVAGTLSKGVVDAFSHAAGRGDPPTSSGQSAGSVPLPYTEVNRSWGSSPTIPKENKLTVKLTNVAEVTLDARRAGLAVGEPIVVAVETTTASTLRLAGVLAGRVLENGEALAGATVADGTASIPLTAGRHLLTIASGIGPGVDNGLPLTLPATGDAGPAMIGVAVMLAALVVRRCTCAQSAHVHLRE